MITKGGVYMKKRIGFLLTICMTTALIACGDIKSGDSGKMTASGYSATAATVSGGSSDTLKKERIKYRFNDYEPVSYKDVVWTAMSEKMSEKEYAEFSEYLPALTGEAVVHWQQEEEDEDEIDFDEVRWLLFWDITGDGVKELILEASAVYPHIIIHKEGNEFYGTAYVRRWFRSPQKSGYFWIGKGNGGWNYLSFRNKKFEITPVTQTELKWGENGEITEEKYYIQDKKVNKKKYKEWEKKNLTGRIKEYELPVTIKMAD